MFSQVKRGKNKNKKHNMETMTRNSQTNRQTTKLDLWCVTRMTPPRVPQGQSSMETHEKTGCCVFLLIIIVPH